MIIDSTVWTSTTADRHEQTVKLKLGMKRLGYERLIDEINRSSGIEMIVNLWRIL